MSNDDSRDTKTPDRQDVSNPPTRDARSENTHTFQSRLEQIDTLTRALLAEVQRPQPESPALRSLTDDTRRELSRHLREIRAEVSYVGLHAIGPEATMPYHESVTDDQDMNNTGVTVYHGPDPEAFERVRDRRRELDQHGDETQLRRDEQSGERNRPDDIADRPDDTTDRDRDGGDHDD